MAILRVVKGPEIGRVFVLKRGPNLLGRNTECDIVLDHDAISRPHARIDFDGTACHLEDLESLNGTSINGHPLPRGAAGRRKLRHCDRIKICNFVFDFEEEPGSDASPVQLIETARQPLVVSTVDLSSSSLDTRLSVNPSAKLRALMEITSHLARQLDLQQVLPKILDSLFQIFSQAQRGLILLRDPQSGQLELKAFKLIDEVPAPLRISRSILEEVLQSQTAMLSRDAAHDERLKHSESVSDLGLESLMCAPLLGADGSTFGVIELDVFGRRGRFSEDDLDLLATVAQQLGIFIENARLHEVALRQQRLEGELRRLEHDLEVARKVQRSLLPATPPRIAGYQFFHVYEPAEQVGGDYYDYIFLPGNRLAIVVADVSGEGVPAALLMTRFAGETRHYLASGRDPTQALARLNSSFHGAGQEGRFITLVAVVLDLRNHEASIVNAGHWPPLWRRADGSVSQVANQDFNPPLGWFSDIAYTSQTIRLEPGDSLLLFTDGINEAKVDAVQMYGHERLIEQFGRQQGDVATLGKNIFRDVRDFVGDHRQSDDMCLLCFGRTAGARGANAGATEVAVKPK